MKKFYYYLTVYDKETYNGWRRIHQDIVSATDKKDGIKKVSETYNAKLKQKVQRGKESDVDYKIFIVELTPDWEEHWLSVRDCTKCQLKYTLLQSQQMNSGANYDTCSNMCRNEGRFSSEASTHLRTGPHNPVIYKITHRPTGRCYIGQTTQAFTLRWYQHFFQSSETKFHSFIKNSRIEDWFFEVVESLPPGTPREEVNERERVNIVKFNALTEGFNSTNFTSRESTDE